jgi:hypothetical protein
MAKEKTVQIIRTLIKCCEDGKNGKNGQWDVSTDEGKESFDGMINMLKELEEECVNKKYTEGDVENAWLSGFYNDDVKLRSEFMRRLNSAKKL